MIFHMKRASTFCTFSFFISSLLLMLMLLLIKKKRVDIQGLFEILWKMEMMTTLLYKKWWWFKALLLSLCRHPSIRFARHHHQHQSDFSCCREHPKKKMKIFHSFCGGDREAMFIGNLTDSSIFSKIIISSYATFQCHWLSPQALASQHHST